MENIMWEIACCPESDADEVLASQACLAEVPSHYLSSTALLPNELVVRECLMDARENNLFAILVGLRNKVYGTLCSIKVSVDQVVMQHVGNPLPGEHGMHPVVPTPIVSAVSKNEPTFVLDELFLMKTFVDDSSCSHE